VISSDFIESNVLVVQHTFGKLDDEVRELRLTDAVLVAEAAALARTVTVRQLVLPPDTGVTATEAL